MLISQFIFDRWNNSHSSYSSALQLVEGWGFFFFFVLSSTPCRVLHCCVINWPELNSAPSDTAWQTALLELSQLQYCGTRLQSMLLWFKCWLRTLVFCAQPAPRLVPCDESKGPCTEPTLQLIITFSTSDTGGIICLLPSLISKTDKDKIILPLRHFVTLTSINCTARLHDK